MTRGAKGSSKPAAAKPINPVPVPATPDIPGRNVQLDSLRGLFALMVLYSHIELLRFNFGLSPNYLHPVILQLGAIGVTGFFVLSGFLITINLLRLKERAGLTNGGRLKLFYTKRILRIWPLYYAIILLSIYVLPHVPQLLFRLPPYVPDARLAMDSLRGYYLFLLPQVPLAMNYSLPYAEPSWSIGVEEVFYLLAPLFVFYTKGRILGMIIVSVILAALRMILYHQLPNPFTVPLFNLLVFCRFECILIGCIAGVLHYREHPLVGKIKGLHLLLATGLLVLLTATISKTNVTYAHFALLFAVVILYAASQKAGLLRNKVLVFIGVISFSLYMTHEIAISFILNNKTLAEMTEGNAPLLYVLALLFATGLGFVTYKLIEQPFMRWKERIGKNDNAS